MISVSSLKTKLTGKIALQAAFFREISRLVVLLLVVCFSLKANEDKEDTEKIWSGSVAIGGEYQYGNTKRTTYNGSIETIRKTDLSKWNTRLLSNYASDETGVVARNTFFSTKLDRSLSENSSWYISESLLTDEFQDIGLRSTTGTGIAYQFIDRTKLTLLGEAGLAYVTEDFIVNENQDGASGRVAGELEWQVGTAVISDKLEVLPSLEDETFLLRNEASLTNKLGAGWSLKIAHIIQHDSDPVEGVKKTDVTWMMALQFAF